MHPDDINGGLATDGAAHAEYIFNAGMDNPDQEWILSPWDSWGRNPFYKGPATPHPEEDNYGDTDEGPFSPYESEEIPF